MTEVEPAAVRERSRLGAGAPGPVVPVESLTASVYTVPTDSPEADGTLSWEATTMVLVEVRAAGLTGIGWTYGPAACAHIVGELLAGEVVGSDPMNVTGTFESMVRAARNAGRPGVVGYAISAVDLALWDLKARLLDLPLHRLLGAIGESVPVYGSGGFTTYTPERQREQLTAWTVTDRIPRVKIKIGESWGRRPERDLDRIAAARDVIGRQVELYVDANGAYTAAQAIRLMDMAARLDVRWLEEPVSSDDLPGLRHVRDAVTAEVTAGEYGCDLTYFHRMCAAGAVDCLQVDVTRCGGITEWLRVAALAAGHQLRISGHCAPHMHAHVAAAVPNLRHLEWFHDHVRIEEMFFDGTLDPAGGRLRPDPLRAGNGLVLRPDIADRYRVGEPVTRRLARSGAPE
jgi:L-alanine-DL-glutamate epimerase-like enolase superfamily enzyme